MKIELSPMIRALAGQDPDFAREANGVGFDRTDGGRGHQLATIPETEWTAGDRQYAEFLAAKYRRQLEAYGFTVPKFESKRCDQARAMRVIDGRTVLTFGYDAGLIETLKRSVRARWDAQNKWWVVQPGSEAYAAKFAADNGFEVTESATVAVATAPKPEPPKIVITTEGGRIVVRSPYSYAARLKAIPGARWDADERAWTYPESAAVAQALAWVIGEQPGLNPYLARAAAIEQAATLKDANDLPEIPGLKGESWLHQRQAYWFCMGLFGYQHGEEVMPSQSPSHGGGAMLAMAMGTG